MDAGVRFYGDFNGLAQLRADAAAGSAAGGESAGTAREAARQFEALFVQMMLKSMRDANAAFGDAGKDTTYRDMFDQQISLEMTRGRGLGIAEALLRQIHVPEDAAGSPKPGTGALIPGFERLGVPARLPAPTSALAAGPGTREDFRPGSREDFVRGIWPLARRAAAELGVDPRALVAQAALETGWGSRIIRGEDGRSGNNLFGIKADSRWTGPHVTVTTLEYEDGLPKPQRARFRAYPDLAAGFADYVSFLKDNPRYEQALRHGAEPSAWARQLEAAGYATDPRYAEKLQGILNGPALRDALGTVRSAAALEG